MLSAAGLNRVDLLKELSSYLVNFAEKLPVMEVDRGTVILTPEDPRAVLYLIRDGRVQLYKITADGKQCTLTILQTGDIFGETHLFCTGCRQVYASALTDAVLYSIDSDLFQKLMLENPGLGLQMLAWTSRRLQETEDLLEQIAYGDVRARVLYQLLRLCEDFGMPEEEGCRLNIQLTQQDLANMVAASRETVSTLLGQLGREGLIDTSQRQWLVRCAEIKLDRE
ncbi:Crp/Fnr family transcriptional regulator [Desulfotomaculum copahuensis]|uniref:Crp/Fnr family transcriptional regulator n=1 Tax=Desulfotomaculum copahuensis TaxID=1838280 RepID=A0A1B7LKH0_9FIRM|nr:Crp/Fnr family transcriptional regulator [Desulfotomaculum copahuensis]OAT87033.1 hypothetical protein A6M21_01660 [Desulfotomaculum copahuensis]